MINQLVTIIVFFGVYIISFWVLTMFNIERKLPKLSKYPSITILIPAYNEEEGIRRTIESCLKLDYPGVLELLVVDDASKDNTCGIVKEYGQVKLLSLKKNRGKAAAVNKGLKQIKTEYFSIVDADSVVSSKSLKKAMPLFYRKDKEKVGAVISKLKPENEDRNLVERTQVIEYMIVGLVRNLLANLRLLHITPGVLSIYKTDLVKKLGYFDENNLTEDYEIGVRIRKSGHLVDFSDESLVFTRTPNTWRQLFKQRIRWARGFFQTHFKHKDIYFNKKHGLFGLYEFPLNMFSIIVLLTAVSIFAYNIFRGVYEFLFKLINTPSLISWFEWQGLYAALLATDSQLLIPIIFTVFVTLFFVYFVKTFYSSDFFKKNKTRKFLALFLYIFIYSYIYVYIILKGLFMELTGKKYDWGTKK